jgi:hypothetical protein
VRPEIRNEEAVDREILGAVGRQFPSEFAPFEPARRGNVMPS